MTSWLSTAIAAFGVMVYALLHCSLTTEQAFLIIGLSFISTCGALMFICGIMSNRLQRLRGELALMQTQSKDRIATLKDLQEKIKRGLSAK